MIQLIVLYPIYSTIPAGFGSDPLMMIKRMYRYIRSLKTAEETGDGSGRDLRRLRRLSRILLGLEAREACLSLNHSLDTSSLCDVGPYAYLL